ncbi:MAG: haloacid dehalogenase type II [Candidatus Sedimenticola endophacoides]|uniref:(S)-2-haloacid dehalogenase n=1 Tax=Candidatus Sedimenticola endophacoides TaxID=2548426 RepID=A0A6N4E5I1_9GAMM|nr:MAG: haloacid dehalogenase, type II [Candidatus Sedimenticola endophacoides]OQX42095.1 MAG: haloacid dehalogenase, type II [Candidatus Sedimenticola endophacoides]PUE01699.1 MAG: haloacid dehalogenase type II [Candidatus Sedimenticola endophacoides]PUE04848.1 MAG: haloacid dehalogenase type II [Candidatus Sedimenticola endophacoides]PUE05037.1 MAG: haloacid dehalogenase type II [Candidatus Sedimenticola endophacoides]
MTTTLAFDVYGTLIDTHGMIQALEREIGERATAFSHAWREKQLEYAFRRGLMQNYRDFGVCTAQALDFTCARFGLDLDAARREALLGLYQHLPAFADAGTGLEQAGRAGFRLYAFSNGSATAVTRLLDHAGLGGYFEGIVSTDELCSFKPNPAVYSYFLRRAEATGDQAWLISSNPFDVIGAISAGMRGAWIRRSPDALFDPWEIEPSLTLEGLAPLAGAITGLGRRGVE